MLRNLLGAFQFSGDDVDKKIRALSGGEKTRLVMARMLLDPPNFLVLDEPTNHLDLATKEMLVEALADFEGTMLFVSHDRTFLRGLSNRVLELGGETRHRARAARLSGLVRRVRGAHRPRGAGSFVTPTWGSPDVDAGTIACSMRTMSLLCHPGRLSTLQSTSREPSAFATGRRSTR